MPGQIFARVNFHGLGFIREYSETLYTAKISTYTVATARPHIKSREGEECVTHYVDTCMS